jgi:hypothetical protein
MSRVLHLKSAPRATLIHALLCAAAELCAIRQDSTEREDLVVIYESIRQRTWQAFDTILKSSYRRSN